MHRMNSPIASVDAPPTKPPFSVTRVIRAVPLAALGDFPKLLICEVFSLWNGPEGCFMGAGPMAKRLGCSVERVEEARRALQKDGLLSSLRQDGRRTASWYVTVPADCVPLASRPTDADVSESAKRLGNRLSAARGEWRTGRTPDQHSEQQPPWRTVCTPIRNERTDGNGMDTRNGWRAPAGRVACTAHATEVLHPPLSHLHEVGTTSTLPPTSEEGPTQESRPDTGFAKPALHRTPRSAEGLPVSIKDVIQNAGWDRVRRALSQQAQDSLW
jgi:hypothetical protein